MRDVLRFVNNLTDGRAADELIHWNDHTCDPFPAACDKMFKTFIAEASGHTIRLKKIGEYRHQVYNATSFAFMAYHNDRSGCRDMLTDWLASDNPEAEIRNFEERFDNVYNATGRYVSGMRGLDHIVIRDIYRIVDKFDDHFCDYTFHN
jgi:hypothetical protein